MKFRDLRANEIDCRVQSVKYDEKHLDKSGIVLLLYKDARVDMNILDETVGTENWQREHYEVKGNLFCRVGIREGIVSDWVWKSDCGVESNTEAQKGEASDSFKRACFNWGIGRELYTAPFIWIPADKCNIKSNNKGGYACYDNFEVSDIVIENKEIKGLVIKNSKTKAVVFEFGTKKPKADTAPLEKTPRQKLLAKLEEKGINATEFAQKHNLNKNTPDDVFIDLLKDLA